MQTFLPSTNFKLSAESLDSKRLNKQILEGYQILNVLSGQSPTGGWRNHPAVLMWKNAEHTLWEYIQSMITEAKYRNIKTEKNELNLNNLIKKVGKSWGVKLPFWFSDEYKIMRITTTHKANLFKKDSIYYAEYKSAIDSPYNIPCCSERKIPCQYYWVTHETKVQ